MPNRPAHFEIHATNPEALVTFYTDIFGWEFKKWEGGQFEYWMIMTGGTNEAGGINGGLTRRKDASPAIGQSVNAFVCTIVIDNFDEYAKKIQAAGGAVALPKMAIAGMAWQGYFHDTDGNLFGLHEADVNAK